MGVPTEVISVGTKFWIASMCTQKMTKRCGLKVMFRAENVFISQSISEVSFKSSYNADQTDTMGEHDEEDMGLVFDYVEEEEKNEAVAVKPKGKKIFHQATYFYWHYILVRKILFNLF